MFSFKITRTEHKARLGEMTTAHGPVATPVFMPCGTAGTVKGVTPDQLRAAGVQMLLGNTYHLMLRPGADVVAELGGLHRLMAWDGPILTDSGGYQVFSLALRRKLTDDGVIFQSHVDGAMVELTPERCIEIQIKLGSDVMMQLDECPPGGADREVVAAAVERSARWAARCKQAWEEDWGTGGLGDWGKKDGGTGRRGDWEKHKEEQNLGTRKRKDSPNENTSPRGSALSQSPSPPVPQSVLFGIQQGGTFLDLREQSARRIVELDLPGYAIGGLSVGEGHEAMVSVLEAIDSQLPADRPRYLMGVGEPRDILAGVLRGVDMFDCVLPTRNGRNAQAFTWNGRMKLRNAAFTRDGGPIDPACPCYTCRNFSRAALRHYFMAEEMLGPTLVTIHNLAFFGQFMAAIRAAIAEGRLAQRAQVWLATMYGGALGAIPA